MKVQMEENLLYIFSKTTGWTSNSFFNFIKKSLKPVRLSVARMGNYDEILLEINKTLIDFRRKIVKGSGSNTAK